MTVNEVTSAGITTKPLSEITSDLTTYFQTTYGADINIAQNSPDGQMIGIFSQLQRDLLDLITQVYNSFDPDAAEGTSLDSRVAINGIQRNAGTYTVTPVTITVDRALTLPGLDTSLTPFTVQDTAGNQYQLQATYAFTGSGSESLSFQATNVGAIQTLTNTITTQVTIVLGVTAVNNPSAATIGINEETDADLKIRRQASLAIGATNSLDSLRGNLLNLPGVADAYVWENYTGSADTYSTPGHCIWVIVDCASGIYPAVAQTIYAKRSAGCNMRGSITEPIIMPDGNTFTVAFDQFSSVPLYIKITLTHKTAGATYDADTVKSAIVDQVSYKIFQEADSASIVNALQSIVPLFTPSAVQISINNTDWYEIINPTSPQNKFVLTTANISVSGS